MSEANAQVTPIDGLPHSSTQETTGQLRRDTHDPFARHKHNGGGQHTLDTQPTDVAPTQNQLGHPASDTQRNVAQLSTPSVNREGQIVLDTHGPGALSDTIDLIVVRCRCRNWWLKTEGGITRQIRSALRTLCDGDKEEADELYKALEKGQLDIDTHHADALFEEAFSFTLPMFVSREDLVAPRKAKEREIRKLARQLPVWEWVKDVRGCGELSLALIVGAAGNLSNYSGPDKLKKRLGLAPYKGKACSTWRREGGLSKEEWVETGYKPSRGAVHWNLGKCFIRAGGEYKEIYDARVVRDYHKSVAKGLTPVTTVAKTRKDWLERGFPELVVVKTVDRAEYITAKHLTNRAQRYMMQQFIVHLWLAWRRFEGGTGLAPSPPPASPKRLRKTTED